MHQNGLGVSSNALLLLSDKEVTNSQLPSETKNMPCGCDLSGIPSHGSYKVFTFDGVQIPDAKVWIAIWIKSFRVVVNYGSSIKTKRLFSIMKKVRSESFLKYPTETSMKQVWQDGGISALPSLRLELGARKMAFLYWGELWFLTIKNDCILGQFTQT